jgi:hypothetical protein
MEWLDTHSGSVVAVATFVLVALTGYYAWTTRSLVRETHVTLQAGSRATLQARLDRISELFIQYPELYTKLNDEASTGKERDGRFFVANMFLGVIEEAYTQYAIEHSMSSDDWGAWVATAEQLLPMPYIARYWREVSPTFEPSFRRFVDEQIQIAERTR